MTPKIFVRPLRRMMTPRRRKILIFGVSIVSSIIIIGIVLGVTFQAPEDSDKGARDLKDIDDPTSPLPPSGSILGKYSKAAVATNGEPCAEIGKNILLKNGSAIDATVAALFCEGVTCLQSMGLGGGFLMTIYEKKSNKAFVLDARETAPAAADKNMYHGNESLAQVGGLAIAVPGELRGYWEAHKRFGRLPWRELVMPTVELCRKGSPVNAYIARFLRMKEKAIKESPSLREILINPATNHTWEDGDRIKRLALADTLEIIAEEGGDALYNGSLAKKFVDDIQSFGGIITLEDMANYKPNWDTPIEVKLKTGNVTLITGPPPGSGVLVAFGMNILDGILPAEDEVTSYQRIVETFKYMYGRRTELGDPAYTDVTELVKNLTSKEYALAIRQLLSDNRTWQDPEHYGAVLSQPDDHGTAHVSVLSPDGDAVSVTSTVNLLFGGMIRSQSTGIILNDEMDDFSAPNITNIYGIPPSPANFIHPGKRPLSSMCPAIFVDNASGNVRLVVGAAGGSRITTATMLASIHNLWFNKTIKEAIDASRIHHQLFPMKLQYEYGVIKSTVEGLKKIGHDMQRLSSAGSTMTAIAYDGETITANSDFRRLGVIAGF
ncbi:scoloptoxin SSD14-like isoform X2 [Ischnura elegans]|uniref:scoloptoxin SSD14-like isoform X2 n=1 Tax=Ischnura elegans TaxID=197161 RepID=UPI001ED88DAF|nr:scoloptoxin SSD14-like isoform X2 [Ischnura elegans]